MNDPIFKPIFGADWDKLPPVMQKHYAIRPYTDDKVTVEGEMDVMCAGPVRLLAPLFWLTRNVPPVNETGVPVSVHFESDKDRPHFHFHRIFHFKGRKPYHFHTAMVQVKDNEVIEMMAGALCWRMNYLWEGGKVILRHILVSFRNCRARNTPLPRRSAPGGGWPPCRLSLAMPESLLQQW